MVTADRSVTLEGPANTRDLGGLPVAGGVIRRGLVYRSDALVGLTPGDRRLLANDLGIRTVIDLRSSSEVEAGRTELIEDGVAYHHLPIGGRLGAIRRQASGTTMAESYVEMASTSTDSLAAMLVLLATPGTLPAAFHCAGGKDRAGIAAATILSVVGAEIATIADDYALTGQRFEDVLTRLRSDPQYADVLDRVEPATLTSDATTMATFLALLDDRHGGLTGLVRSSGIGTKTLETLRDVLIEPTERG